MNYTCGNIDESSIELSMYARYVTSRPVPNILFVFYSAPNSGQNALFVFGRIVEPKISQMRINGNAGSARP